MTGGTALTGRVRVTGAKNSALKLMAAALLAPGRTHHRRGPRHPRRRDHERGAAPAGLRGHLRAPPGRQRRRRPRLIDVPEQPSTETDYDLVRRMRASISVLGPLVARLRQRPGGAARRRRDRLARPGHAHLRPGAARRDDRQRARLPRRHRAAADRHLDLAGLPVRRRDREPGHGGGARQRARRSSTTPPASRRSSTSARCCVAMGARHRRRRHLDDHRRGRRDARRRSATRPCPTGSSPARGRSAR